MRITRLFSDIDFQRILIIQPSVPTYRIPFFELLSGHLKPARFMVYASRGDLGVLSDRSVIPSWERPLGTMRTLIKGLYWQSGVLSIDVGPNDLVIISGAPRCLSNIAFLLKCKFAGAKVVWWGHYWSSTSKWLNFKFRIQLLRFADAALFYTDAELSEFRGKSSSSQPAFALNNGMDCRNVAGHRTSYRPDQRPRDLLFIGRLTKKADLALLFNVLAFPECAHLTLDVIGDGEEREALEDLAARLSISQRIHWHGGVSEEGLVAAIANRCKVFVYPGSVGLSLIHAMAYGLPSVVHDDRWKHMPEISALSPGKNGLAFRYQDAASLSLTLSKMLSSEERLCSMSACAIQTTQNSFNTDDMAKRFIQMVAQISHTASE